MKLNIDITLNGGGTVRIFGEDLTAEDVNEVFAILGGYSIEGSSTEPEDIDTPLPGPITDDMKDAFVEGFQEARPTQEDT